MFTFPLLLTLYAGFAHAFEADHLLAVSNIVSRRNNITLSIKDGIFWGLGHASTILIIGIIMILFKAGIPAEYFRYFEATVGVMLIVLAIYRLMKFYQSKKIIVHTHSNGRAGKPTFHVHMYSSHPCQTPHPHSIAYGIGLVHGLAGSGALIVIVLSRMKGPVDGLSYLLLFGIAGIAGMMLAAGLFSIPFSKKMMQTQSLQGCLVIASSLLCLLYGSIVIYKNVHF